MGYETIIATVLPILLKALPEILGAIQDGRIDQNEIKELISGLMKKKPESSEIETGITIHIFGDENLQKILTEILEQLKAAK
jgi:Glu-tRNA(Gln) amidotransferase subunit E-like FAD-binding protein